MQYYLKGNVKYIVEYRCNLIMMENSLQYKGTMIKIQHIPKWADKDKFEKYSFNKIICLSSYNGSV
ncbi:hypothetical protein HZS_7449 [Henneguya salminicola]|nr:hypothetical protein HZS_7449 [Henneguya salminicola]